MKHWSFQYYELLGLKCVDINFNIFVVVSAGIERRRSLWVTAERVLIASDEL